MTNREALQALLDGKKIRKTSWVRGIFIQLVADRFIDQLGRTFCFSLESSMVWELYEEPLEKCMWCGGEPVRHSPPHAITYIVECPLVPGCVRVAASTQEGASARWNKINKKD